MVFRTRVAHQRGIPFPNGEDKWMKCVWSCDKRISSTGRSGKALRGVISPPFLRGRVPAGSRAFEARAHRREVPRFEFVEIAAGDRMLQTPCAAPQPAGVSGEHFDLSHAPGLYAMAASAPLATLPAVCVVKYAARDFLRVRSGALTGSFLT